MSKREAVVYAEPQKPVVGKDRRIGYIPEIRAFDVNNRTIEFVSSTESVDRYGDILRVKGWRLENYLLNPIFLFGHKSKEPPIGRSEKTKTIMVPRPALVQAIKFATKDAYPFAETIFKLYLEKMLNAVSVGFRPLKEPNPIKEDDGMVTGYEYIDQELLELSAVPIPANPEALARAINKALVDGIINNDELSLLRERGMCGDENPAYVNLSPGVSYSIEEPEGKKEETPVETEAVDLALVEHSSKNGSQRTRMVFSKENCEMFRAIADGVKVLGETNAKLAERLAAIEAKVASLASQPAPAHVTNLGAPVDLRVEDIEEALRAILAEKPIDDPDENEPDDGDEPSAEANKKDESISGAMETLCKGLDVQGERIKMAHTRLRNIHVGHAVLAYQAGQIQDAMNYSSEGDGDGGGGSDETGFNGLLHRVTRKLVGAVSKSVIPYKDDPIGPKGQTWDAGKEMGKQSTPAGWKRMCTIIDGDPANKTSYKLPHHNGEGFSVNRNGVRAALGRVNQTQPAADRGGARSHLTKHQKKIADSNKQAFDAVAFEKKLTWLDENYQKAVETKDQELIDTAQKAIDHLIDEYIPLEAEETKESPTPAETAPTQSLEAVLNQLFINNGGNGQ